MSISEIDKLHSFIEEFSNVIEVTPQDDRKLCNILHKADALYSEYVPEIVNQYEEVKKQYDFLSRNCHTVLALLKREYTNQTDKFEAGIMSLTYENLKIYPKAQEVYKSGMEKYAEKKYDRNIQDDMRLSLELLVKQILNNDKSLENQKNLLGDTLSNYSDKFKNFIIGAINSLCTYQNDCVKHNYATVTIEEIDFIIEYTSTIINFLIKAKYK